MMVVNFSCNLSDEEQLKVLECSKFLEWRRSLSVFDIHSITVLNACFWGDTVGYILVRYDGSYSGRDFSQHCLVKGHGASALIILTDETGLDYVVLVGQSRFPAGKPLSWELPAGMIDSGSEIDAVVREVQEEVGDFGWSAQDYKLLTSFYPCSGGSDEKVFIFFLHRFWKRSDILKLSGLQTGLAEENEFIVVDVFPFSEALARCAGDAKTMIALLTYENTLLKQS